jgi:hypothetical protein
VKQNLCLDLHVPNLSQKLDYENRKIYAENLHRYELSVNCRESHNTSKQQVDGNLVFLELPNRLWRNRDPSMKAAAMVLP